MQKYQTFSKRFWAGLIDSLLVIPLSLINMWLPSLAPPKFILVTWVVISFTAFYIYEILMHGFYGQTLGKMITKVKVVDLSEGPITMWQSVLRDGVPLLISLAFMTNAIFLILNDAAFDDIIANRTGFVLTILMYGWLIVDIVTFLVKRRLRAAHDFIAGTMVVRLD